MTADPDRSMLSRTRRDLHAVQQRAGTLDRSLAEAQAQLADAASTIGDLERRLAEAEARPGPEAPLPGDPCPTCRQRMPDSGVVPFHLVLPIAAELDRTLTDDDRKLITQLVAGAVTVAMGEALERITHQPRAGIYVPRPPGGGPPPRRS